MLCRSAFFRYSLSIATPIMVQNLISTLVNVADTVRLGYISQSSLAANVFLNAVFIFGLFGFPMLGLMGVALATVIARFAECAMCLIHFLSAKSGRLRVRHLLFNAKILTQDLLKISIPPILNDASYSLAGVVLDAILGRLGSDVVAANAVAVTGLNLGAVASRGISNATTVILGKALGEGDTAKARVYAKHPQRSFRPGRQWTCCIVPPLDSSGIHRKINTRRVEPARFLPSHRSSQNFCGSRQYLLELRLSAQRRRFRIRFHCGYHHKLGLRYSIDLVGSILA